MDNTKRISDIKMIEEVKKNECLYNVMCPKYKEFEYKERIWAKIGKETGQTAMATKRRWKSIRDGYKRSKQKTTSYGFQKPYKYAEYVRFLDNVASRRDSKPILPTLDDEVSTDLSSEYEFKYENPEKQINYDIENVFDDTQEPLETSITIEDTKIEHFEAAFERTTKDQTETPKSNDNEECAISSKEEQVKEKDWIDRLIAEVKKYECIYNTQSERYKHFEYKKRLWHRIGKRFGLKGKQTNRKWKSLRDTYRRYKLKSKAGGFVRYKHAVSLKFLDNYINIEPSKSLNLSDAEVSTELSSDNEFMPTQPNSENSFEVMNESWGASSLDDNSKIDFSNPDTNASQMIETNEKNNKTTRRNSESEECSSSSEDENRFTKNELIEKIISEVKKHECIYNKKLNIYRNFPYKKRLWYKIGKTVGLPETEVRAKWKSLRYNYRKYKLKSLTEGLAGVRKHKYADSMQFLDEFLDLPKNIKRGNKLTPTSEKSIDLSIDSDFSTNQELTAFPSAREAANPIANEDLFQSPLAFTITSRLFQLLANKIHEENLTAQQKNDIEYAVSAVVYSKLAEYSKNKSENP